MLVFTFLFRQGGIVSRRELNWCLLKHSEQPGPACAATPIAGDLSFRGSQLLFLEIEIVSLNHIL